jgi:hypothetical protein
MLVPDPNYKAPPKEEKEISVCYSYTIHRIPSFEEGKKGERKEKG